MSVTTGDGADPFDTARLRRGVLDAWAASPARFREDANAEEDLALGGYRDRLVVELAQNAADAASRAGVPGRLRLTLRSRGGDGAGEGPVLVAANTGAPLDAAGVESLSTLRASAKREESDSVGRFGVGFAAVLAVSDEPAVVGRTGGVRWSLTDAQALAREAAADPAQDAGTPLGEEIRRRDGHVPLLRLPLPAEGAAPVGYDTAVILPLRDGTALDLVRRLLADVDDSLLLTLTGLEEIVIEGAGGAGGAESDGGPGAERVLRRVEDGPFVRVEDGGERRTWRVVRRHGTAAPELLADRPTEERLRPHWSVTWAVPVVTADGSDPEAGSGGGDGTAAGAPGVPGRPGTAPVVHAPTPTDEPLGVPALLIASFPLDPTRRHPAPGPFTDFLVARAADAYAELLASWDPVTPGTIDLVPGPLGKGELDGSLRAAILERLPRVAFLPPAAPTDEMPALRPFEAEVVEGAGADTVRVLAEVLPTLLPGGHERRVELRTLGVGRLPLGDAIERIAGAERPPAWWHRLYESLAGVDPDRLSGLPVPLASGRTAIGPRQVLLPLPDAEPPADLGRLGLKVAHPEAVHPLLEKLGALAATPRAVLTTPQVRAAVAASLDADDIWYEDDAAAAPGPEELAETVLRLVRDAGLEPGDEPWLGALALPDEDGELAPAGELVLPGSEIASVLREDELAYVDSELAQRWGEQPLAACGVLAGFALVRATDVVLDPDELEPRSGDFPEPDDAGLLDAVDVWCEDVLDRLPESPVPPVATEIVAVRDLDLVDDDAWPRALALLARPPLRDALTQRVRVLLPDGTVETVRPYTAWWLRGHPVLDGRRPAGLRAAGGDPLLDGLYDAVDATGFDDAEVLRALGVRTSTAALLAEPGGAAELLGRLADPERAVRPAQLRALYTALSDLDPEQVTLPDELRAVVDGRVRVVDAADALVADAPDLLPLTAGLPLLPVSPSGAAELAELLQVRRLGEYAAEEGLAEVASRGEEHDVPEPVRVLLGAGAPRTYVEHEELVVHGPSGDVELDWRRTPDGTVHVATLEGVAAGLAWAAGQWPRRFEVAALLEDPTRTAELERDRWFDA
ncbi:sacsin N-terminal ATP-binding-like domain-containing protein [Streptomyces fuscigenes]|uniref:sacsin N-terminal ATP-binding-like domain-containing protein n=1 Tax=Streptomyces fuscigenes TaxID=1528880 RepID=UPI001F3AA90D|nr:molecular chaperone Hsp90 [Streptomyces fuscigenes]MCF3963137.1 molecular chaperone Hsp90 [Streptomyces fuscigenes]